MSRVSLLAFLLFAIALPVSGWSDVTGSSDPLDFPRYPRSEIIFFSADPEPREHEFIVSHVEKIRRQLKVEDQVRVQARETVAIYQMPVDASLDAVTEYYRKVVKGDDLRFSCRGRDCGRSAQWANQVFGQSILYGPDAGQFYLAGKRTEGLVSVYIIERGNRRVLVLLRLLATVGDVAVQTGSRMVQALGSNGHVVITGVTPAVSGALSPRAIGILRDLGGQMGTLREETVYVVCHLYAPGPAQTTIARSTECATNAVEALRSTGGPTLVPFGAGPLLPREERAARIELVLPHRRARE